VVYWLVLRPVKTQALAAFRALPGKLSAQAAPQIAGTGAPGALAEAFLGDEGKRAAHLKQQLTAKVAEEPASASRLVQSWVREQPK
jgi:hypothetical protein